MIKRSETCSFREENFLFKYFTTLISLCRICVFAFHDISQNLQRKLGNWKEINLSQAGRITLTNNSILNASLVHALNMSWLSSKGNG